MLLALVMAHCYLLAAQGKRQRTIAQSIIPTTVTHVKERLAVTLVTIPLV